MLFQVHDGVNHNPVSISVLHNANKLMYVLCHYEDASGREQEKQRNFKKNSALTRQRNSLIVVLLWAANISAWAEDNN